MNTYIVQLKAYLNEHFSSSENGSAESLFEILYLYYAEHSPHSDKIQTLFQDLEKEMVTLSLAENDIISDIICGLCIEYQRRAFLDGVQIGACLMLELSEE